MPAARPLVWNMGARLNRNASAVVSALRKTKGGGQREHERQHGGDEVGGNPRDRVLREPLQVSLRNSGGGALAGRPCEVAPAQLVPARHAA